MKTMTDRVKVSDLCGSYFKADIEHIEDNLYTLHLRFSQDPDCAFVSHIEIWAVDQKSIKNMISALENACKKIPEVI